MQDYLASLAGKASGRGTSEFTRMPRLEIVTFTVHVVAIFNSMRPNTAYTMAGNYIQDSLNREPTPLFLLIQFIINHPLCGAQSFGACFPLSLYYSPSPSSP